MATLSETSAAHINQTHTEPDNPANCYTISASDPVHTSASPEQAVGSEKLESPDTLFQEYMKALNVWIC